MTWKAIHFDNNDRIDNNREEHIKWNGLKSPYYHKQVKELIPFENDFVGLFRNIKFRKIGNTFQEKLNQINQRIKENNDIRGQDFKYCID